MFRTKEIISTDRARFARAWNRFFLDYGNRGGGTEKKLLMLGIEKLNKI